MDVRKFNFTVTLKYKTSIYFRLKDWNYCILDEGHIIKNSKTKVCRFQNAWFEIPG